MYQAKVSLVQTEVNARKLRYTRNLIPVVIASCQQARSQLSVARVCGSVGRHVVMRKHVVLSSVGASAWGRRPCV